MPVAAWTSRARALRSTAAIWFGSRVVVFLAAVYATWVLAGPASTFVGSGTDQTPPLGPIASWHQWDLDWYASIAQAGYGATGFEDNYAYLPGFPAILWVFAHLGVHPTLAGLVVAALAGFVAAWALARLTEQAGGRGDYGVVAWVVAPAAVYLAAPYPEALFCAFAFSAWLLARRQSWAWAGILAAAASVVRVNGVFLALALVVLFLTAGGRRWRDAPWLALPFLAIAGVLAYYHALAGSWTVWLDAQSSGWHRQFTAPWQAWQATWDLAFNDGLTATFAVQYRLEILAVLGLVAFVVILLARRWWAEATYVGLTLAALATSTQYYSVPRAYLTLFPVWVLIGVWATRRRWVLGVWVIVALPLMLVGVVGFVTGHWIA
jgi:hypothetical protein